jgi:hypothetical protein
MDYENGFDSYSQGPPMKKVRGEEGGESGHGMDRFLERQDEKIPPNHILLITVINNKYPINVEVIYKVTSIVGKIKRIVCFERNKVIQAMVEFETLENASKVSCSNEAASRKSYADSRTVTKPIFQFCSAKISPSCRNHTNKCLFLKFFFLGQSVSSNVSPIILYLMVRILKFFWSAN